MNINFTIITIFEAKAIIKFGNGFGLKMIYGGGL